MKHLILFATALVATPAVDAYAADGVTVQLRGSRASVRRQHEVARDHDLTFLRTPAQVREFVRKDRLEPVRGNADYSIARVSFPYARPAVKLFIERLAAQYRAFSGEKLVVTSLTRPKARQPRNASPLSVHPTGIAVDFRVPRSSRNRKWLEETLLSLERSGVLDATKERRPPHYHVAVFPELYEAYVERIAPNIKEVAASLADDGSGENQHDPETEDTPFSEAAIIPDPVMTDAGFIPSLQSIGLALLSLGAAGGGFVIRRRRRMSRDSGRELS